MLFLLLAALVSAEPCKDDATKNVVQLTSEKCTCCDDLDDFIQDYDYAYILFYSKVGRLNTELMEKFHIVAEDYKYSRVHFAKIDVDADREMAKKWIDPDMIPTNIMWKFGKPLDMAPKDFEMVRDHYRGHPDGHKWMLNKYMSDKTESVHFAQLIEKPKALNRLIKGSEVVLLGAFTKEDKNFQRFNKVVYKLHQNEDGGQDIADAGVKFASTTVKEVRAKIGKDHDAVTKFPAVLVYVDGSLLEDDIYAPKKWTDASLTEFLRSFLPLGDQYTDERAPEDL